MHKTIEPSILYFGTPVTLISTRNEDGTTNVAPMSSAWFLGWSCMIGLASDSKTPKNLVREQECVLNFPSVGEVDAVNRLAKTTGSHPISPFRVAILSFDQAVNALTQKAKDSGLDDGVIASTAKRAIAAIDEGTNDSPKLKCKAALLLAAPDLGEALLFGPPAMLLHALPAVDALIGGAPLKKAMEVLAMTPYRNEPPVLQHYRPFELRDGDLAASEESMK